MRRRSRTTVGLAAIISVLLALVGNVATYMPNAIPTNARLWIWALAAVRTVLGWFLAGLGSGSAFRCAGGLHATVPAGLVMGAGVGTACRLTVGYTFRLRRRLFVTSDIDSALSPQILLRADRRQALAASVVFGIPFGLSCMPASRWPPATASDSDRASASDSPGWRWTWSWSLSPTVPGSRRPSRRWDSGCCSPGPICRPSAGCRGGSRPSSPTRRPAVSCGIPAAVTDTGTSGSVTVSPAASGRACLRPVPSNDPAARSSGRPPRSVARC